jgi:hypothetical protein
MVYLRNMAILAFRQFEALVDQAAELPFLLPCLALPGPGTLISNFF